MGKGGCYSVRNVFAYYTLAKHGEQKFQFAGKVKYLLPAIKESIKKAVATGNSETA